MVLVKERMYKGKTLISDKRYGLLIYNRVEGDRIYCIHVQNNEKVVLLKDEQDKYWLVDNYNYKSYDGCRAFPQSREFEERHFERIQDKILEDKKIVDEQIFQLSGSMDYSQVGTRGKEIAREKGRCGQRNKLLIKLKSEPYNGRFDMIDAKGNTKTIYVGEDDYDDEVVSWASKIAEPYMMPNMYRDEGLDNRLLLKRIFAFKNYKLQKIKDEIKEGTTSIQADEHLYSLIEMNRDEDKKNIIRTIEEQQYKIIANEWLSNMVVMGCAGSGKSVILAHRLAFWNYRLGNKMLNDQVYIVTSSPLMRAEFGSYEVDLSHSNTFTLSTFNKYILNDIMKTNNLLINDKKKYLSDSLIDDLTIPKIYDQYNLGILTMKLQSIMNREGEGFEKISLYLENILFNEYNASTRSNITLKEYRETYKKYDNIKQLLNQISMTGMRKLIHEDQVVANEHNQLVHDFDLKTDTNRGYKKELKEALNEISVLTGIDMRQQFDQENVNYMINYVQNDIDELKSLFTNHEQSQIFYESEERQEKFNRLIKLNEEISNRSILQRFMKNFNNKSQENERDELLNQLIKEEEDFLNYNSGMSSLFEPQMFDYLQAILEEYTQKQLRLHSLERQINRLYAGIERLTNDLIDLSQSLKDFETIDLKSLRARLAQNKAFNTQFEKYFNKKSTFDDEQTQDIINTIKSYDHKKKKVNRFFSEFEKFNADSHINILNDFIYHKGDVTPTLYIIDCLVEDFKKEILNIKGDYEFEIFLQLYLLNQLNYKNSLYNKVIMIDEVQDYTYAELKLYQDLFMNATFSYYGDIDQSINTKGLTEQELNQLTSQFTHHKLTVNYRNAKEITDYINSKLGKSMVSIGLKGHVMTSDLKAFVNEMKTNDKSKVAMIMKNPDDIETIKNYNQYFNIVGDDYAVDYDLINIFTPQQIKGLEFNFVFVNDIGMNDQEKYVSYSRAIKTLYINKSN